VLRTSAVSRGEHEVVVDYPGSATFEPSSVVLRHRVE
jgi:hypothetical protein